jgi:excinuclease ABC subunit C
MKNERFSLADAPLYPHFKLTRERFPRLLATRRIDDGDGAEYFGAFLPDTGVRFLIDYLNKTFRLRACEIAIDGRFDVPCTQFYRRRCVAPCVASLCSEAEYAARVELVRLFLRGDREALKRRFLEKIEIFAAALDFEAAGEWRDLAESVEKILTGKDWNFRLDDAIDTFEIEAAERVFYVYLVTMRGRRRLGRRVFVLPRTGAPQSEILPSILPEFYRFHAPKEIRVARDFPGRIELARRLGRRFGHPVKISVIGRAEPKIMTGRALGRTKYEHEFRRLGRAATAAELAAELKASFDLAKNPRRVEGYDVAHISGRDFVAARSVWEDGKFLGREYEFSFSDEGSELDALRRFVAERFAAADDKTPDLVLVDGGKSHLLAALKALETAAPPQRDFAVVSAVKPPRRHGEISHFLLETGARVDFDGEKAAHRLLQTVRDEAHELSNEIHRQRREMSHFYELAAVLPALGEKERRDLLKSAGSLKNVLELKENELRRHFPPQRTAVILRDLETYRAGGGRKIEPLIVPLRYTDENGDAQDLRPLASYRTK